MIRFALRSLAVVALAGGATGYYFSDPEQVQEWISGITPAALGFWDSVKANPTPWVLGVGSFLLTVAYHKMKGKSFREAVETAATRVTVVTAPTAAPDVGPDHEVTVRARNRATKNQLLSDQIGLQNRLRKLPEEITKKEKDAAHTERDLQNAKANLESKQAAHDAATTELAALRREKETGEREYAAIQTELDRLKDLV